MVKVTSTINKDRITINKESKKKIKTSAFLVTINSNRSDNGLIDYNLLLKTYKELITYLFSDSNAIKLIKCKACDVKEGSFTCNCTQQEIESKIESIELKTSLEEGPMFKKLHSHTFVTVKHTTKIHIDKKRVVTVGKYFMDRIGMPGIYVNIQYINSGIAKATQYVSMGEEYVPLK